MRVEFGEDEGVTSHAEHRRRLAEAFRKVRNEIDAFNPDFILMFGDDQYENFKEDLIPAFCLLAYDEFECKPWAQARHKGKPNFWGEAGGPRHTHPGTASHRPPVGQGPD